MRPVVPGGVPAETARVARAAFPGGSLAIRIRDELGVLFRDEQFADLFASRGRSGWSPSRLALVLVLQFVEGLTDRQAAEAVRARIDFKYALGLELCDPGFNFSVLSEFRDRLVAADGGRRVLDGILTACGEAGLLGAGGKARTDSTHVLSAARQLCWLELVAETVRAALNALAVLDPEWLAQIADPDWFRHYATRAEDGRFPKDRTKRAETGLRIGRDGARLLAAVAAENAPAGAGQLAPVRTLALVWQQQFETVEGQLRRRSRRRQPRGAVRVTSPYDTEARTGIKREISWDGYAVHLTETCDAATPNLITHVATVNATVTDCDLVPVVHDGLAGRGLLPRQHFVDAGYIAARHIVSAHRDHGITLVGPTIPDTGWQKRARSGFDANAFAIDWDRQKVTCPGGKTSTRWAREQAREKVEIRVQFSKLDCRPCVLKAACTKGPRRKLTLQERAVTEALRQRRADEHDPQWQAHYKTRAGIEGTIAQGVLRCGLRRSRYRGLAKTALQHQLTAAAINLARIDAHLTGTPKATTRTSHFAALRPADHEIGGTKQTPN